MCYTENRHEFTVCAQVAKPDTKAGDKNNKKEKNQDKGQGGGGVKEVNTEAFDATQQVFPLSSLP